LVLGDETLVLGDEALVLGDEALVLGDEALVLGDEALVLGDEALVLGNEALVLGNEALVLGNENSGDIPKNEKVRRSLNNHTPGQDVAMLAWIRNFVAIIAQERDAWKIPGEETIPLRL
jgi:hypothetical protein